MVRVDVIDDENDARSHDSDYTDEDDLDEGGLMSSGDDDDSDLGSDDGEKIQDESLLDRLYALRDMVPPKQRRTIAERTVRVKEWVGTGGRWAGRTMWIVTTSALLLGLPLLLAIGDEQKYAMQEREMQMQQAGAQQLFGSPQSGSSESSSGGQRGITAPGFA